MTNFMESLVTLIVEIQMFFLGAFYAILLVFIIGGLMSVTGYYLVAFAPLILKYLLWGN